jgi:fatty-acyl-CoA synthase
MNDAGGVPISQRAQARCVDFNTGEITPQGEIGELQFQGPSQMLEYFGDKAATQNAFTPDGFIRSGDCGFMRENGGFVFKSRMGDILKISGYMTSPAEIEALIMTTPLITQCQVVGVDTEKGMRTFAFVTSTGPLDEAKLIHHCKQRMASYKVPARIIVINEFPMTVGANAPKVQKVKLREIAQTIMTTSKINNH